MSTATVPIDKKDASEHTTTQEKIINKFTEIKSEVKNVTSSTSIADQVREACAKKNSKPSLFELSSDNPSLWMGVMQGDYLKIKLLHGKSYDDKYLEDIWELCVGPVLCRVEVCRKIGGEIKSIFSINDMMSFALDSYKTSEMNTCRADVRNEVFEIGYMLINEKSVIMMLSKV